MALRMLRVWVAAMLLASGGLLYAASWQRWAGACPWVGDQETRTCDTRSSDPYGFLLPSSDQWIPVGDSAQLAGVSLLVFAVAVLVLPWALAGRKFGRVSVAVAAVTALSVTDIGVATLRSGLDSVAVSPVTWNLTTVLWLVVPPFWFGYLAAQCRGWARAAALLLVVASPLVAAYTYAVGSFDDRPWWEAISGVLMCAAGACVLVAATRRPSRRVNDALAPGTAGAGADSGASPASSTATRHPRS